MNTYFTPTQRGLLDIKISLKIWRTCILAKFILSSWIWILLDQLQELGLSVVLTEKKKFLYFQLQVSIFHSTSLVRSYLRK